MPNDYDTLWDRIQEAQAPNSTTSDGERKSGLGDSRIQLLHVE